MKKEFKFTESELETITGDYEEYRGELVKLSLEALLGTAGLIFGLTKINTNPVLQNGPILAGGSVLFYSIRKMIRLIKGRGMYKNGAFKNKKKKHKNKKNQENYEEENSIDMDYEEKTR